MCVSGGQRRRVSLAMALLHDPKLLILDEPTVGTDSILRCSIWDYLVKICQEDKKTVLITTHYIDEGRQAHMVGFMRKGRLLCERSPQELMERYSVDNLEDVFIKLCEEDVSDKRVPAQLPKRSPYSLRMDSTREYNKEKIMGEINKNLIFLKRNLSVAAFTLLMPSFCLVLFNFTMGRDPDKLNFGVMLDESGTDLSTCKKLPANENCNLKYLSCIYVEKLQMSTLDLIEYQDLDVAIGEAKKNHIWGVIHFPSNYSKAVEALIKQSDIDDGIIENRAQLYMDYSSLSIMNILNREVTSSFTKMFEEVFKACNWSVNAARSGLKFEEPVYGDAVPDFRIYFGAPMITMSLMTTPLLYGLTIMIEEKITGSTARSIIAGVSVNEILISHLIVQCLLQVFQLVTAVGAYAFYLGFPFRQPFLTCCLLYLQSIVGIALAFTVTAVTDSLMVAGTAQLILNLVAFGISGMIWPLEGIPWGIHFFSWFSPGTYSIEAIRSLTIRGWDTSNFFVCRGFVVTFVWIISLSLFVMYFIKATRGRTYLRM